MADTAFTTLRTFRFEELNCDLIMQMVRHSRAEEQVCDYWYLATDGNFTSYSLQRERLRWLAAAVLRLVMLHVDWLDTEAPMILVRANWVDVSGQPSSLRVRANPHACLAIYEGLGHEADLDTLIRIIRGGMVILEQCKVAYDG